MKIHTLFFFFNLQNKDTLICILSQENLLWKDFNIETEAKSAQKPLVKQVSNVSVTNNFLEIRFYWAGKGTTRIPGRGFYGPLVSSISAVSGMIFACIVFPSHFEHLHFFLFVKKRQRERFFLLGILMLPY